jgi:hypothetical protein
MGLPSGERRGGSARRGEAPAGAGGRQVVGEVVLALSPGLDEPAPDESPPPEEPADPSEPDDEDSPELPDADEEDDDDVFDPERLSVL